jgi:hypothetical protein
MQVDTAQALKELMMQLESTYQAVMADVISEADAGAEFLASYQQYRDEMRHAVLVNHKIID